MQAFYTLLSHTSSLHLNWALLNPLDLPSNATINTTVPQGNFSWSCTILLYFTLLHRFHMEKTSTTICSKHMEFNWHPDGVHPLSLGQSLAEFLLNYSILWKFTSLARCCLCVGSWWQWWVWMNVVGCGLQVLWMRWWWGEERWLMCQQTTSTCAWPCVHGMQMCLQGAVTHWLQSPRQQGNWLMMILLAISQTLLKS